MSSQTSVLGSVTYPQIGDQDAGAPIVAGGATAGLVAAVAPDIGTVKAVVAADVSLTVTLKAGAQTDIAVGANVVLEVQCNPGDLVTLSAEGSSGPSRRLQARATFTPAMFTPGGYEIDDGAGDGPPANANYVTRAAGYTTALAASMPWFNLLDFGAKLDGATDDTAAWNAFLNYLGDLTDLRAAMLYVPGLSLVTSTIIIGKKALWVCGAGWGTAGVTAGSGLVWGGAAGVPMLRFEQCYGARISRFRFKGNSAAKPSSAVSFYNLSTDANGNSFNTIDECFFGVFPWDGSGPNNLSAGVVWEGDNVNGDRNEIRDSVFDQVDTGVSITQTQNVQNKIERASFIGCATGIDTNASCEGHNLTFLSTTGQDVYASNGCRVELSGYASEGGAKMATLRNAVRFFVTVGYWQLTNSLAGSGVAGNHPVIDGQDSTPHTIHLRGFEFPNQGYTNPGTPTIALGPGGNSTLEMTDVNTSGLVVPDLLIDSGSGRVRNYRGVALAGLPFSNMFQSAVVGFNWEPPVDTTRYDLGAPGLLTAMARNGLILGDGALDTAGVDPKASKPTLWGGNGVPGAGLGANGDYYLRFDGAASAHLYFKSAGAWTGLI